jgi:hypothetical protein
MTSGHFQNYVNFYTDSFMKIYKAPVLWISKAELILRHFLKHANESELIGVKDTNFVRLKAIDIIH